MVRYYTHIAFALFIYIFLMFIMGMDISVMGVFLAGWISVLPDIIERFTGKHREVGHSIFWTIPLGLVSLFNLEIGIALVVGILIFLAYLRSASTAAIATMLLGAAWFSFLMVRSMMYVGGKV